jgi:hypothetical protein
VGVAGRPDEVLVLETVEKLVTLVILKGLVVLVGPVNPEVSVQAPAGGNVNPVAEPQICSANCSVAI